MLRFISIIIFMTFVIGGSQVPVGVSGALAATKQKVVVIFMHGKGGDSDQERHQDVKSDLESAGFKVVLPDMTWSRYSNFHQTYEEALLKIQTLVKKARAEGAQKVILGGHSLGGNAAFGYGAIHGDIDGIVASAPAHNVLSFYRKEEIRESVHKARAMVAAGEANKESDFMDRNQGAFSEINTTAKIYLSFFDPTGPAVIPNNVRKLKRGIPVLWIRGKRDRSTRRGARWFKTLPPHPKHEFVVNSGGHRGTANRSIDEIIRWIRSL